MTAPAPAPPNHAGPHPPTRRRLAAAMLLVGLVVAAAAAAGIGVRSTNGGHAAVDEPQYLLTALSLGEDGALDLADELRDERWRAFHDRDLPEQTAVRPDGGRLSPHDPLLPVLLAAPMAAGGWVAAKATLAAGAGLLAALTLWTAVRRFGLSLRVAAPVVALAGGTAPLAVYGQQVYPELPAALAVTAAVAALTGPLRRAGLAAVAAAAVALPWLSVKYVPVAATLVAVGTAVLLRAGRRRALAALLGGLAAAGAGYLLVHRLVWGGWTVYASGDHFQRSGEFGVVGFAPNYPGRAIRLVGLLVDRDFGLAAWQPAWLLAVPAVAALLATRPRGWVALAAPLAAGWLTATFVALTMHGFWWPGRQVVVVLPLAAIAVGCWLDRLRAGRSRAWRPVAVTAAGLAALGVGYYAALLAAGYARRTAWVLAPDRTDLHPPAGWVLPDDRVLGGTDLALLTAWTAAAVLLAVAVAWRPGRCTARRAGPAPAAGRTSR